MDILNKRFFYAVGVILIAIITLTLFLDTQIATSTAEATATTGQESQDTGGVWWLFLLLLAVDGMNIRIGNTTEKKTSTVEGTKTMTLPE